MSRFLLTFAFACALVVSAGSFNTGAKADDKKAEKPPIPAATPQSKAVDAVAAAYTLAAQTDKNGKKSPLLLLAAARVIGTTNFADHKPSKEDKITSESTKMDPKEEAGALIDEALKLAGDDETIKKLAATVKSDIAGFRGEINGPQTRTGRVDAKYDKTDSFYFEFRGGQTAVVSVANLSNAGDLDLKVYDLDGNLVKQDTRANGGAYVSFYVPKNNRYRVVLVAYAGPNKPLSYRLTTN